jgi:hypothetical protein
LEKLKKNSSKFCNVTHLISIITQEKERQSWEATCESLRSKLEASENARLKSEIESTKHKSKFATSHFDFGATLIHLLTCLDILQVNWS